MIARVSKCVVEEKLCNPHITVCNEAHEQKLSLQVGKWLMCVCIQSCVGFLLGEP